MVGNSCSGGDRVPSGHKKPPAGGCWAITATWASPLRRAYERFWVITQRCGSPRGARCTPSKSCPSAGSSSAALRGGRRTGVFGRTASAGSTPVCSSSIWHSWLYYSEDREHVLSLGACGPGGQGWAGRGVKGTTGQIWPVKSRRKEAIFRHLSLR